MHEKSHGNIRVAAWITLTAVLVLEFLGGIVLMWSVLQAFFAASNEPLGPRVSILLSAIAAFAWVAITLGGALRKRAGWARGSAMTLHVLMFAAGTGILQGIIGDPLLGWALVLCALVGFFAAMLARPSADGDLAQEPSTS